LRCFVDIAHLSKQRATGNRTGEHRSGSRPANGSIESFNRRPAPRCQDPIPVQDIDAIEAHDGMEMDQAPQLIVGDFDV
jgi:hypothetical protein